MRDVVAMVVILGLPLWAMVGVWLIERMVYGGKRPPSEFDGHF